LQRCGVFVFLGLLLAFLFPAAYAESAVLPRLAVIIDDLGNNAMLDQRALRLAGPITASILPLTPYVVEDANMARAKGLLIIAHLPMQADNGKALGPGGLTEQMMEAEFKKQLAQDLDSISGISGVSNHMGSRLTRNRQAMQWVMEGLKGRSLFYLDSRTCPGSVAADSARRAGIPTLERDVFLDHDRNAADIEKQFDRMLQIARRKGSAIAIGHPFPETLAMLERRLPQLSSQGFQLVRLDALLPTVVKR
jgi:polysaccharide deacetylase 2 family uncharacterized protein YibQ